MHMQLNDRRFYAENARYLVSATHI